MTSEKPFQQRTIETFSAFKITNGEHFDFCPEKYSMFKFGSFSIAREFGHLLADRFINNLLKQHYKGQQLVVLPSAYSHIPTASFYMKMNFVDRLNYFLFANGYPVVEESKIYRTVTYREDYGEMSAEERFNLIKGDTFYVDKDYLENKVLIFIDDIKITGTHERIIIKMLDDYQITNPSYMLYLAELTNPNVPPSIENYLNLYFVKNLDQLDRIVKQDEFVFNSRVVKYILNSAPGDFDNFVAKQKALFLQQLYHNAIGNEYFKFVAYERNLNTLSTMLAL